MSQLPQLRHEDLDETGRAVWDSVVSTRGERVINEHGHLIGPFNTLLTAPVVGLRVSELGASLRYQSSLDQRLLELAVITVAAHWQAEFEWASHSRLAAAAGVSDEVISAIARGEDPPLATDDERTVYTVVRQLVDQGRLDAAAYTAGHELLGDQGLVELVTLCGYYSMVSFGLNAFDVPLLPGETPQWPK